MTVIVYTDGACSRTRGGWAWYVHDHLWDAGAVPDATNNQMEMLAVIKALETMAKVHTYNHLMVVSDSAYVVNCFKDRWYAKWRKNSWKNGSGEAVKNRELWERLIDLFENHEGPITFRHCRGHGRGGPDDLPYLVGNDKVDRLAVAARETLERT